MIIIWSLAKEMSFAVTFSACLKSSSEAQHRCQDWTLTPSQISTPEIFHSKCQKLSPSNCVSTKIFNKKNKQTVSLVEVWRWIFVRNAVKRKQFSSRLSYIILRWMRWFAVNYLFSPRSLYSYKKRFIPTRVRTSELLLAFNCLIHCCNLHVIFNI